MNLNTQTPGQALADAYAATVAGSALKAVRWTALGANAVALGAMAVTITHQHDTFIAAGMPEIGAWGVPAVLDILTFVLMTVVGAGALVMGARLGALALLILPVGASAALNASGEVTGLVRCAYVAAVVAIPVAKGAALLAHRIDWSRLLKTETAITEVAAVPAAPAVDEAAKAKRSEAARKAAATRKDKAAIAAAERSARAAKRAARVRAPEFVPSMAELPAAPVSPGPHTYI